MVLPSLGALNRVTGLSAILSSSHPKSNVSYGEGFSMRAGVSGCGLVLGRPALEFLPRWKPRGLGGVYGDCVQVVALFVY